MSDPSIGELADEQLSNMTKLGELLDDLVNDREVYQYQVREGSEAVETAQDNAAEILRRYENENGPV